VADQQESWFRTITRNAAQIRKRFGVSDRATQERMVPCALRCAAAAYGGGKETRPGDGARRGFVVWSKNSISLKTRNNWQAGFEGTTPAFTRRFLSDVTWCYGPAKVTGGRPWQLGPLPPSSLDFIEIGFLAIRDSPREDIQ
jgi:hypothetical protein